MEYRIMLTQNGEYKKTFYKSKNKEKTFTEFRRLTKESDDVMYEQKHVNSFGIIPVAYKLWVVKLYVEGDPKRYVRNHLGKLVEEDLLFNKWLVLNSIDFRIEENFWLYGHNPKSERKSVKAIVDALIKGIGGTNMSKEVIVVHNKLIIYNEDHFDMVICKCLEDAQRLHHLLYYASQGSKIKGLLFMGTATPITISLLYEIIHEETGWKYEKIRRTTTRP